MNEQWNPRFVLWARAIGKVPEDFKRGEDDELARVEHPTTGQSLPWTFVFSEWIRARWKEWAAELGYKDGEWGTAERSAIADGRDRGATAFDPWLERYVERLRVLRRDGEEVKRGTEAELFQYLHRTHSFSVQHALKHEGYELLPLEEPG